MSHPQLRGEHREDRSCVSDFIRSTWQMLHKACFTNTFHSLREVGAGIDWILTPCHILYKPSYISSIKKNELLLFLF